MIILAEAQHDSAIMYLLGQGGKPVDFEEAAIWEEKAAVQGYPQAIHNLARMYLIGKGKPKNPAKAKELYKQSCELGIKESCDALNQIKLPFFRYLFSI
ncbi:tetratricopeptide repeat protein [Taylorella equigenitalis]|uniref:tetratricopeptide repeat protein n=2 Tax=Taylorella equigenitalis TaxID=29575 RepID=UPI00237CDB81|nr:tetratricopeptide repeat protein [Taylorella equigenitalis]WDU55579.1 sel1 repeat family protein [Taylorella equigenitalis]